MGNAFSYWIRILAVRTQISPRGQLATCYQHAILKHVSGAAMTNKTLRERLKMPENVSKKFMEYLPHGAGWVEPFDPPPEAGGDQPNRQRNPRQRGVGGRTLSFGLQPRRPLKGYDFSHAFGLAIKPARERSYRAFPAK